MSYTSKELCERAGITARQMDHWFRRGWLVSFARRENEKSGHPIEWPLRTMRKAVLMNALITAGLKPERAHKIAEANLNRAVLSYPWTVRSEDIYYLPW